MRRQVSAIAGGLAMGTIHHGRLIGSMAWNLLLTHPLSRLIIVKLCKETTSNSSRAAQQSPRLVLECEWFLEIQDCNIGAGHNALAERR